MPAAEAAVSAVLDASALLAYLREEPGADVVGEALDQGAAISSANWAEVLSKVAEIGQDPAALAGELRSIGLLGNSLMIEPLSEEDCIAIAVLRPQTCTLGFSLGDRACLALGRRLQARILTTDRAWMQLDDAMQVEMIRP